MTIELWMFCSDDKSDCCTEKPKFYLAYSSTELAKPCRQSNAVFWLSRESSLSGFFSMYFNSPWVVL